MANSNTKNWRAWEHALDIARECDRELAEASSAAAWANRMAEQAKSNADAAWLEVNKALAERDAI